MGTQVQSNTDFNVYGNDIENFAKFKGNDKHDAMRMTRSAATDVKKAFMQLQHEFPDVQIAFEPMPNPQTFGKKREGFFNYQQALNDWKDIAMTQIANAREATMAEEFADTRGTVVKGAIAAMDTVNARADELEEQIDDRADGLEEKVDNRADELENSIEKEGRKTRGAVYAAEKRTATRLEKEGQMTRNALYESERRLHNDMKQRSKEMHRHMDTVQDDIAHEGKENRKTSEKVAKQTQEAEAISDKIDAKLNNLPPKVREHVSEIRKKIQVSNLSYGQREKLLSELADMPQEDYINAEKLSEFEGKVNQSTRKSIKMEREEHENKHHFEYDDPNYHVPHEDGYDIPDEPKGKPMPKSGRVNPFDKHVKPNKPLPKGEPSTQPLPKDEPKADGHGGSLDKPNEDKPDGGEPATPPSLKKPEEEKLPKPEWQK